MTLEEFYEIKDVLDHLSRFGWIPGDDEERLELAVAKMGRAQPADHDHRRLTEAAESGWAWLCQLDPKEVEETRVRFEKVEREIAARQSC